MDHVTITHRTITTNGIDMHIAEAGAGPLVVLLHGFPELWYAWRHQLEFLAAAGYHAVAPDQRGYGASTAPSGIDQYTLLHLVGDVVGLIGVLGDEQCYVVGHDWGSQVAANTALWRSDLVRGVALLSVPYRQRSDQDMRAMMRDALGPRNYVEFFQEPGVAERVLEVDPRAALCSILIAGAAGAPQAFIGSEIEKGDDLLIGGAGTALPGWLTDDDLDFIGAEFGRTGFGGGLNWYRNATRNWELTAPWYGAALTVPSMFACGTEDQVYSRPGMAAAIDQLRYTTMPGLVKTVILAGCGHWIQQERPDAVSDLLVDFLEGLRNS